MENQKLPLHPNLSLFATLSYAVQRKSHLNQTFLHRNIARQSTMMTMVPIQCGLPQTIRLRILRMMPSSQDRFSNWSKPFSRNKPLFCLWGDVLSLLRYFFETALAKDI